MYTVIFVTVQYLSHVYTIVLNFNLEFLQSVNDETSFRGNISDVNEPEGVFVFPCLYSVMNLPLTAGKYGVEYLFKLAQMISHFRKKSKNYTSNKKSFNNKNQKKKMF